MTPTSGSRLPDLLHTSAAIAFLVEDHADHEATFVALADRQLGQAGHAAFETFSVLTRLPPPARLVPAAALLAELVDRRVTGGSVYDALVGATAMEHGLTLVSRDRRALETYRALGVVVEMLG